MLAAASPRTLRPMRRVSPLPAPQPGARRRRTAAERRAQRDRAEARVVGALLRCFASVDQHRGGRLPRLSRAHQVASRPEPGSSAPAAGPVPRAAARVPGVRDIIPVAPSGDWTPATASTQPVPEPGDAGYVDYARLQYEPLSHDERRRRVAQALLRTFEELGRHRGGASTRLDSALQEVLTRRPSPAVAPHIATEHTPPSTPRAVEAPSPVSSGGERTADRGRLASDTDEEWHSEPGANNQTTRLTPLGADHGTKALLFFDKPSKTPLDDFPDENFQGVQGPPHEEDFFFAVPNLHPVTAAVAPAEVEATDQEVDRIHSMAASSRPRPVNIHDAQVGDVLLAIQEVDICYKDFTVVQGSELRTTRTLHSGSIRCTYYIGKKLVAVYLNDKECEYFVRM